MTNATLLLVGYAGAVTFGLLITVVAWLSLRQQVKNLWADKERLLQEATEATTRSSGLQQQLADSLQQVQQARAAETEAARLRQQLQDMQQQMQEWDKLKQESLQAARASVLQAGQELSSKLLEDHKREMIQARKESEETTQKTTEGLLKHFQTLEQSVHHLHQNITEQRGTVDTMWEALKNPTAAGNMGEIGLENSLKSVGLEAGRDFQMQYALRTREGRQFRPDAVVFLPRDTVMVIDSKASTFLLHMAEAKTPEEKDAATQAVRKSMMAHVRVLASKDYKSTVQEVFKDTQGKSPRRILNVMFVPNEAALEHMYQADGTFLKRCAELDIIPAGPTGLAGLLALSRIEIDMAQQAENHERIMEQTQQLLEALSQVITHAGNMGKSLKQAAEHFHKFGRSVNSRLLPRAKRMEQLGVRPSKGKPLPQPLAAFTVLDEPLLLEAEEVEMDDTPTLPLRALASGD